MAGLLVFTHFATGQAQNAKSSLLTIHGELRGRVEAPSALSFRPGVDDQYFLTRARLSIGLRLAPMWTALVEVQDSRSLGQNTPVPGSVLDGTDLRQAWIRYGAREETGFCFRAGRMPLRYGAGRFLADPDWGNVGQTYDGLVLGLGNSTVRLDLIGVEPVEPIHGAWDHGHAGVFVYGLYGTVRGKPWGIAVEPYALFRRRRVVMPETLRIWGVRATAKPVPTLLWEVEMAYQDGVVGRRALSAWGGVWQATWSPLGEKRGLAFTGAYTHATGNHLGGGAANGTFQVFYPSSHLRTGAVDRLGWSNLRDVMAEAKFPAWHKLRLSTGTHLPWIDSPQDALYSRSGAMIVYAPRATERRIGTEIYLLVDAALSKHWTFGVGVAHLFHGPYLDQAGRPTGATQPYGFLTYRF
jgi:hypothetical protein